MFSGQLDAQGRFCGPRGVYVSSTYDIFCGPWEAGALDGAQCQIHYANGDVYSGAMAQNKRHGFGRLAYPDGSYYQGGWAKGVKTGLAKAFDAATGNSYIGAYQDGLPHGEGTLQYANGSSFVGSFQQGLRHGPGKLIRRRRVRDPNAPPAEVGLSSGYIEKEGEWEVHEGSWFLGQLQIA